MQEWRKMALLMEIRLQENEKRNVSSDYHVQYAANHLEKAKDVFMKAMKRNAAKCEQHSATKYKKMLSIENATASHA